MQLPRKNRVRYCFFVFFFFLKFFLDLRDIHSSAITQQSQHCNTTEGDLTTFLCHTTNTTTESTKNRRKKWGILSFYFCIITNIHLQEIVDKAPRVTREFEKKKAMWKKQKKDYIEKVATLKDEVVTLKKQLEDAQHQLNRPVAVMPEVKAKWGKKKKELQDTVRKLQEETSELKVAKARLEGQVEVLKIKSGVM